MRRDIIGIAQTGTGKTAGFVLPMIDILGQGRSRARMPRSLILEPTRELAAQVAENFEKYGKYHKLSMALLIGGVQMGDQIKALEKGVDVLIATPGRLMDLFGRGKILLTGCNLLVIDEADRMLDMGFIPDIEEICTKLPKHAADPAVLGDDAAADQEAGRQVPVQSQVRSRSPARPPPTSYRPAAGPASTRARSATCCRPAARRRREHRDHLLQPQDDGARARQEPEARRLQRRPDPWRHGAVASASRELDRFKDGEINILVASDVAARGLDIKGVSHVFNYRRALASGRLCPPHRPHRPRRQDRHRDHPGHQRRRRAIDNIEKLTGTKIAEMSLDGGNKPAREEARRGRRAGRGTPAPRPPSPRRRQGRGRARRASPAGARAPRGAGSRVPSASPRAERTRAPSASRGPRASAARRAAPSGTSRWTRRTMAAGTARSRASWARASAAEAKRAHAAC